VMAGIGLPWSSITTTINSIEPRTLDQPPQNRLGRWFQPEPQ